MGSATREALAGARSALAGLGRAELQAADDLLAVTRIIGATPQLRTALMDAEAQPAQKRALVDQAFGGRIAADAVTLLAAAASFRWSDTGGFLAGLEELGIRLASNAAGDQVALDAELFAFERMVGGDAELELALGSKLGAAAAKTQLVDRLLGSHASAAALVIVRHLVQQPRGRRIGEMLRQAASIVADQRGFDVATVTSAVPLTDDQIARLERTLAATAGRSIRFDTIVDPAVLGGVRIQIGDDVIDGSVATRLTDLRLQLAG
jgi:F-type H+-transporting ATPase subunit delta